MSVSDNLIPGETITFESQKHWIAPARDSLPPVGLIVLAGLLGIIKPGGDGFFGWIGSVLGVIQWGLVIVGVVWIVYNVVVWRTAQFAVTNLRVLRYEGLIKRRSSETLLSSVTDVRLAVGLVGRQLGYGDLRILTGAGEAAADEFRTITTPTDFRNAMMARRMAAENAAMSGGDAASIAAPAHAQVSVAESPGPAPAAATAAFAATSAATPDIAAAQSGAEAADAIRHLGELRDQGLITDDEFESKKRELLARM